MLIIAEKPSVARKISEFLSKNKYKRIQVYKGVYYYTFDLNNVKYFVVPSIGHLFGLDEIKRTYSYPVFNYEWKPLYEIDKKYNITKKYIDMFSRFKNEKNVIVATDFDIEGELIGYNILRFILNRTYAKRMVFSAITYKDIIKSFNNIQELNKGFYMAGETRHEIDWLYGINLSRALTKAIRKYNKNVILSIGRVQGPTLKLVFDRILEIRNFVPKEFYNIYIYVNKDGSLLKFEYYKKLEDKNQALEIKSKIKNYLNIININKNLIEEKPPHPYNLVDIQYDSYRLYKISPKKTLDILQRLYEKGYVSYPRTSSNRLPNTIDFESIIENLKNINTYKKYAEMLLNKGNLIPNNGNKDDVHPAIHPTGVIPDNLDKYELLIYDLVVRRFLSTFMDSAYYYKIKIITEEGFEFEYKKLDKIGWMIVYWKILKDEFNDYIFNTNEKLKVEKISIIKNKTKPPARYNQGTLIKKMEELDLGTKSTRAMIIDILYKRKYITGKSIEITKLGEKIIDIFDKYFPYILDINMTRDIEKELERLEKYPDINIKNDIINKVKDIVKDVCEDIRKNEDNIGRGLYEVFMDLKKNNYNK